MSKSYFSMSKEEIAKKAALTPEEKKAVDDFMAAAKALPKSITVEVTDNFHGDGNLHVSKRITSGATEVVARLRKSSLYF